MRSRGLSATRGASSAVPAVRPELAVGELTGDQARLGAELAVHLLAQLPATATASLPTAFARDPLIERLARAYRVERSLRFTPPGAPVPEGAILVDEDADAG